MTKTQRQAVDVTSRLSEDIEKIMENGVLIDLNVGWWYALSNNNERDLGIDERPGYVAGLGTHRLVPKHVRDEWRRLASRARSIVAKRTFVFPLGETRFIPVDALPTVEAELRDAQREIDAAKRRLSANFARIKQTAIEEYRRENPKNAAEFARRYPARDDVLASFYIEWAVFNVSLPKRLQLRAFSRKKADADAQALARYRQDIEHRLREFAAEAATTLRARTVEFCTSISAKLKAGEVVTERSLTALRDWIARFREMNFVGDRTVDDLLQRLDTDLLRRHTSVDFANDEALATQLAGVLGDVQKAAEDITDIEAITGGLKRKIHVV